MIRLYIVVLQLLGVLFVNILFSGDISVTMDLPGQINAGKELKVQITLKKGDLKGFSRFQMDLPPGVTAANIYSANADFSFKDQKVRLIWLRLPDEEDITVSFTILCNEHLKGSFDLSGKFSYIENNERKTVEVQPKSLAIVPSPDIDPNMLVDIKDFGRSVLPQMGSSSIEDLACIRQKPAWSESSNEYLITLLVNKESLKKFAKIEETVPAGYTALAIEKKEGVFTFKDNKAKFLWMNLPADPYFTVSYKLIPMKSTNNKQLAIKGVFSFINDDKTQSMNVMEQDVSFANLTPELVKSIVKQQTINPVLVAQNTPVDGNPVKQETTEPVKAGKEPVTIAENTKTEPVKDNTVETKTAAKAQTTDQNKVIVAGGKTISGQSDVADLLEPQSGLYFRVQIAAGHKPVNTKSYFRKYQLDTLVMKEKHDGWIKYSVGLFNVYKVARDYRVHLWNTTSINDAFVAAYNDGKRITVQEALMIGNQRWYQ
jgi:hypothetical protein